MSRTESSCNLSWQLTSHSGELDSAQFSIHPELHLLHCSLFCLKLFPPNKTVKWSSVPQPFTRIFSDTEKKHSQVFTSSNYPWTERGQGRRSAPHPKFSLLSTFDGRGKEHCSEALPFGKVRTSWVVCSCAILKQINLTKARFAGPAPA